MPHPLNHAAERTEDHLYDHALAAAFAAEETIHAIWSELVKAIAQGGSPMVVHARTRTILDRLYAAVASSLAQRFEGIAREAHRTTVSNLEAHLPVRIRTSDPSMGGMVRQESLLLQERLLDFVLPAPSAGKLLGIVFGGNWTQRLASITRLAAPAVLAAAIAKGTLELKTPYEIAREIRPLVQGVQVSARRIARTESLRIAHTVQLDTYEQLGDMVIGYQVHAVLDSRTRPEHRHRDGFQYFKRPKPGQLGMDQCPHPPMEANGKYAFNCRCFLTPIFGDMDAKPGVQAPALAPRDESVTPAERVGPTPVQPADIPRDVADLVARMGAVGTVPATAAVVDMHVSAGGLELWRGVTDKQFGRDIRAGKPFFGDGDYGKGLYFSTSRHTADLYGDQSGGETVRAGLAPNARIIEYNELDRKYAAWRREKGLGEDAPWESSAYARMLGYDAVTVPHQKYVLVINPAAVLVQRTKPK